MNETEYRLPLMRIGDRSPQEEEMLVGGLGSFGLTEKDGLSPFFDTGKKEKREERRVG